MLGLLELGEHGEVNESSRISQSLFPPVSAPAPPALRAAGCEPDMIDAIRLM